MVKRKSYYLGVEVYDKAWTIFVYVWNVTIAKKTINI